MPLRIRNYKTSDKTEVLALHKLALQSTGAWIDSGRWDEDLDHIGEVYLKGGAFLIGEAGGRIVAMGALRRVSYGTGEIKRMRVHPDFQRKGYGQLLLTLLEERAKELGFKKLILDTTMKQTGSQVLYLKNGYTEVRREHIKTANIDTDLIYYEKNL